MIAELTDWAARVTRDAGADGVRVVVLAGAGKTFCAGADVAWMAKSALHRGGEPRDAWRRPACSPRSTPCRCRSSGASTAPRSAAAPACAVCDIVVADEDAVFGFTEVKLGILPAVIRRFAGERSDDRARELF